VRRWEWLTLMPKDGFLPQSSHTAAMADVPLIESHSDARETAGGDGRAGRGERRKG
jgi:hypothetical protein